MFRPMRRKHKEISDKDINDLLTNSRRGILAVNGENNYPYAVPINYVYDEDEHKIYFHGSRVGHKIDSIKNNDKICFTVFGHETIKAEESWAPYLQSVVIFGRCHLIDNPDTALEKLKLLAEKFYPDEETIHEEITASGHGVQMFEIEIEHMTGKQIQEK